MVALNPAQRDVQKQDQRETGGMKPPAWQCKKRIRKDAPPE